MTHPDQKSTVYPKSTLPILAIEVVLFSITFFILAVVNFFHPLGSFENTCLGYLVFAGLTILVLRNLIKYYPLKPGIYNFHEHPTVCTVWQIYSFLVMNNLFMHYQNGLLPIPMRKFLTQLLGAKIGAGIIPLAGTVMDPYLIEISENTIVGQDAILKPSFYHGNTLTLGKITIEEGAVIGARSLIMPDVRVGKNAVVKTMSYIEQGTVIGEREIWGGIPAKKMGMVADEEMSAKFTDPKFVITCIFVQTMILSVSGIATWFLSQWMHFDLFLSLVCFYVLQCAVAAWVMMLLQSSSTFKEGEYSIEQDRKIYDRWNLFSYIGITHLFLQYQRDILPPTFKVFFMRLLGASLKMQKNFLRAGGVVLDPFFVEVERGVMVGADAMLLPHALAGNKLYLKRVILRENCVIGERVLIMPGTEIGKGAVIEPLSLVTMGTKVPDYEIWAGVPARKVGTRTGHAQRALESGFDLLVTLAVEGVILSASLFSLMGLNHLISFDPFLKCVVFYLCWVGFTLLTLFFIRILCPIEEGEFNQEKDYEKFFVWRLHAVLCLTNLFLHYQNGILPPILRKWFFKSLGLTTPNSGFLTLAAAFIADPYFVEIGEYSLVSHETLLLTIKLRGQDLTLRKIKIGKRVFVGDRAVILPGVKIEDDSEILPLSLVEEGTVIPAGEVWGGVPARKIRNRFP